MNNLISVFMNYKIHRLTEYGVFAYHEDTEFIRDVFCHYFETYIDNYYYHVFQTIEENVEYSDENLKIEFQGVMEEMLDDYREYELQVSNEEYAHNQKVIRDTKDIAYELVKIDWLSYHDKDEIPIKIFDFINQNDFLKKLIGNQENQLARLVRVTYLNDRKLLDYTNHYYGIMKKSFEQCSDKNYLQLVPNIKVLGNYRRSMVQKIYEDERLQSSKLECLIQKVSLEILRSILEKDEIPLYFIDFGDSAIARGKIREEIFDLINNPLFKKYVVLTLNYNTYSSHKEAFGGDFQFACIQDFTHINDIFQKVDTISKEGIFHYLIVSDYRYKDRDFFTGFESDDIQLLLFEEE